MSRLVLRPASLLLGPLLAFAGLPGAADIRYEVINGSELTLMEFYTSPVGDGSWGEDHLTVHVLRPSEARTFAVGGVSEQCNYDLRFILEDGKEVVDTANICKVSNYTIENTR